MLYEQYKSIQEILISGINDKTLSSQDIDNLMVGEGLKLNDIIECVVNKQLCLVYILREHVLLNETSRQLIYNLLLSEDHDRLCIKALSSLSQLGLLFELKVYELNMFQFISDNYGKFHFDINLLFKGLYNKHDSDNSLISLDEIVALVRSGIISDVYLLKYKVNYKVNVSKEEIIKLIIKYINSGDMNIEIEVPFYVWYVLREKFIDDVDMQNIMESLIENKSITDERIFRISVIEELRVNDYFKKLTNDYAPKVGVIYAIREIFLMNTYKKSIRDIIRNLIDSKIFSIEDIADNMQNLNDKSVVRGILRYALLEDEIVKCIIVNPEFIIYLDWTSILTSTSWLNLISNVNISEETLYDLMSVCQIDKGDKSYYNPLTLDYIVQLIIYGKFSDRIIIKLIQQHKLDAKSILYLYGLGKISIDIMNSCVGSIIKMRKLNSSQVEYYIEGNNVGASVSNKDSIFKHVYFMCIIILCMFFVYIIYEFCFV